MIKQSEFLKCRVNNQCPRVFEKISNLLRVQKVVRGTKTRSLLNKLTHQNRSKLVDEILQERDAELASILLDTATTQPCYMDLYMDIFKTLPKTDQASSIRALQSLFAASMQRTSEVSFGVCYDEFCDTIQRKNRLVNMTKVLVLLGALPDDGAMIAALRASCKSAQFDAMDVILDCVKVIPDARRVLSAAPFPDDLPFKIRFKIENITSTLP